MNHTMPSGQHVGSNASRPGGLPAGLAAGRGREAMADGQGIRLPDDGYIRINSNENPRGPGPRVTQALHDVISPRLGRGFPPDLIGELIDTIANVHAVSRDSVTVGTGSAPIIEAATLAWCATGRPLVVAAPTYEVPERIAHRRGLPVTLVPVDQSLGLDLEAMADAAAGAGMVFVCNPNNPTGTAHGAEAIERFIRRVKERSPETGVIVDEAYIDYAQGANVTTAVPLALEIPGVVVTRSFSKAHGMAGLRLGYAIAQPKTVQAISGAWGLGSVNTLSAAAGIASLREPRHIEEERAENARVREFTLDVFHSLGYEAAESHTNYLFIDLRRPARVFRTACAGLRVRVGRDFPPFEKTHCRISLGTMGEMQQAVEVFRRVLTASVISAGASAR
jgi:histidinol-phosphate aminotransferase